MTTLSLFDILQDISDPERPGHAVALPEQETSPLADALVLVEDEHVLPEDELVLPEEEFVLFGRDLFGDPITQSGAGKLRERFLLPPFTVLDSRQGYWQNRKRAWLSLGIKSEIGRDANLQGMSDSVTENFINKAGYVARLEGEPEASPENPVGPDDRQVLRKRTSVEVFGSGAPGSLGKQFRAADTSRSATSISQKLAPGGGAGGCWIGGPRTASTDQYQKIPRVEDIASPGGSARPACDYSNRERGDGSGRPIPRSDGNKLGFSASATIKRGDIGFDGSRVMAGAEAPASASGTSIFDPVVCELTYRWFCPPTGLVLDPFAGGSVRGIVAAKLGRRYLGVDLSQGQIEANRAQAAEICRVGLAPEWLVGDSSDERLDLPEADLLFSCPPYGDLETYSSDARDLSAMSAVAFLAAYRTIIARFVQRLRPDRFACFVVGDYRDKNGFYHNFVGETVRAFLDAGCSYYNEAILVTAIGSLPIRVSKQFRSGRKLGKTHQNYLCFVKGDPRRAAESCADEMFVDAN